MLSELEEAAAGGGDPIMEEEEVEAVDGDRELWLLLPLLVVDTVRRPPTGEELLSMHS